MKTMIGCSVAICVLWAVPCFGEEAEAPPAKDPLEKLAERVDYLERQVGDQATSMAMRLDKMVEQIKQIGDRIGTTFEPITRFNTVYQKLDDMEKRLDRLERSVERLERDAGRR